MILLLSCSFARIYFVVFKKWCKLQQAIDIQLSPLLQLLDVLLKLLMQILIKTMFFCCVVHDQMNFASTGRQMISKFSHARILMLGMPGIQPIPTNLNNDFLDLGLLLGTAELAQVTAAPKIQFERKQSIKMKRCADLTQAFTPCFCIFSTRKGNSSFSVAQT